MKRTLSLGIGILTLAALPALAADLPPRYPTKAPVMVAPVYNWTGFYGGLHAGGTWGRETVVDRLGYNTVPGDTWNFRANGFIGGGQLGYNWQTGGLVLGLEGDVGYLKLKGNAPAPAGCAFFGCDTTGSIDSDFYATIRGRAGFAWNQWLLYATGGFIGVNVKTTVLDTCFTLPCGAAIINATETKFRGGWTIGGGAEVAVGGPWTFKAEYLYFDLGNATVSAPNFFPPAVAPALTWPWDTKTTGHIARVGFNYRFGGDTVVARY